MRGKAGAAGQDLHLPARALLRAGRARMRTCVRRRQEHGMVYRAILHSEFYGGGGGIVFLQGIRAVLRTASKVFFGNVMLYPPRIFIEL